MKLLLKLLKLGFWTLFITCFFGVAAVTATYFYLEPKLPSTENLKDVQFQVPLRVFSRDKKLLAEFGEKRRIPLGYDDLPKPLIQAFLAAEDNRFFEHPGVDYQGIVRAALQLLLTGEKKQGGSTITMQVARNFFLTREKTYIRKLNEIFLALRIETELSKEKILELYLNKIYMGHRSYGVGAAAQVYYGKTVHELNLAQIAMVAGLPKAPSANNPVTDPARAIERRNYVLGQMKRLSYISEEQYEKAIQEPVTARIHSADVEVEAPYVAEMVRAEMFERYGENAYTDGYSVYTTIDSRLQTAANSALRTTLQEYDLRHGYRGAVKNFDISGISGDGELDLLLKDYGAVADLTAGIVTAIDENTVEVYLGGGKRSTINWNGLKWARPYKTESYQGAAPKHANEIVKIGDLVRVLEEKSQKETYLRLAQVPAVEGALVSVDPNDGAMIALIGGYDFYTSKFNRVTQALRQSGSGFKPFIYSAALEVGFTPASLINDAPVVFDDPSLEGTWRPENYSGKFFGPTRLRYALTKSRNLVSIRLLRSMGVAHALKYAERFGFDSNKLPNNLSLALGSAAVTPLQMASAYAILANGGYRVDTYLTESIVDNHNNPLYKANPLRVCEPCEFPDTAKIADGQDIEEAPAYAPRVISAQNHYLMVSMMQDVIRRGTATKARSLGRDDLAGKTGTTNEQKDAWFNGFNRSHVAITWVGFDSAKPLGRGEVGGRAALPAWIAYMKEALKGVPEQPLVMPPGIMTVRIDPTTGKRASADQKDAIFEVFRSENTPELTEQRFSRTVRGVDINRGSNSTPIKDEDPF
ncbi:MAG: penicillin-binding protein 1A [Gammaproteobacteria bacterium]|nr:penicillin-binding protein 1A [Gammaproteobacteria bacterium]MCP5409253.1 penicillin-binding protein 1A [Chromatiaceae bacterium]MCP5444659.1 penicillin-binding protein 1A [Chromatiaceae bacterium]